MPALLSTFDSRALSDVAVAIDGCDTEIGAGLAMILAELGAHVRLHGADRAAVEALHATITGHWGRAQLASGDHRAQDAAIRILGSAAEAVDHVRSAAPDDDIRTILIVTEPQPTGGDLEAALAPERSTYVILTSADSEGRGSLAALAALLLSPAGSAIPGQSFTLRESPAGAGQAPRGPLYPAPPVCMPAMAPMR